MDIRLEGAGEPPREPRLAAAAGLPGSYRQSIVTAATFLLGVGLTFARFWAFAPGAWTLASVVEGAPLVGGIASLVWALFRALDPADEDVRHYQQTRRLLLAGIGLVFLSVLVALVTAEWVPAPSPE